MSYLLLKTVHVSLVVSSYTLFFLRGVWSLNNSRSIQQKWVGIIPHVVDTLLLIVALSLAFTIRQFPFVDAWLTTKVICLFLYVGLGFVALSVDVNKTLRFFAWLAAQAVFFYIVLIAITHSPVPWKAF